MMNKKRQQSILLQTLLLLLLLPWRIDGQSKIESLKNSFELAHDDSVKATYSITISRQIHYMAHDEVEEYEYANKAINHALKINDLLLYARALDNHGLLYRYHQHYNEALSLHAKAFELVKDKDVKPIYKMIFANNAGVAGRYNQKYVESIGFYLKALKIAEREQDLKNIAISSNGIGNALGNIPGREEEALSYYEKSLAAETNLGDSLGIAMNYLSISDYYIQKEDFEQALGYLDKLLKINLIRKDVYGIAITYEFYGKCYMEEKKDLQLAIDYYQKALNRFKDINDVHKQADILVGLGNVYLMKGQAKKAKESFTSSLALAQSFSHQGLIMQNSYKLSHINEKANDPTTALLYLKQGKLYEDSIKLSEQKIEIESLIRKYNLEKQESLIQLLQKDKSLQKTLLEAQRQQLNRRRLFIVFMAIGFILIIAIVLLQYRNAQTKRKAKALLEREEQEKMKAIYEKNLAQAETLATRLKINPHFLFNSLNAIKYLIQSEQNKKAMKYLVVFSRYTRIVLETSQKHIVPLNEELQLTRYYLTLEENRFENDFTYEIEQYSEKEMETVFIPPLLLQPFIENAVWHGLLPSKKEKKVLLIKIVSKDNQIKIIIDDNGVGRKCIKVESKINTKPHKSMGMEITKNRIALFNKSNPSKINCEVIDKTDDNGQPAGTRVILSLNLI